MVKMRVSKDAFRVVHLDGPPAKVDGMTVDDVGEVIATWRDIGAIDEETQVWFQRDRYTVETVLDFNGRMFKARPGHAIDRVELVVREDGREVRVACRRVPE